MAKFKIAFTYRVKKDVESLSDNEFNRITESCKRLEDNPAPDGKHIKKLRGYQNLYPLRVGDYRIVFEWKGLDINIVTVLTRQEFGKRY